jgi:hypothetical protein
VEIFVQMCTCSVVPCKAYEGLQSGSDLMPIRASGNAVRGCEAVAAKFPVSKKAIHHAGKEFGSPSFTYTCRE